MLRPIEKVSVENRAWSKQIKNTSKKSRLQKLLKTKMELKIMNKELEMF